MNNLSRTGLSFEANAGQTDARVDFIARAGDTRVFLTPTAAVFAMQVRSAFSGRQSSGWPGTAPEVRNTNAGVALYMDLVGANPAARPIGLDELPGRVNYFLGNDPARWHSDVPTYGRVEYPNVYPGISLAYHGGAGGLEYDFILSPGADTHAITLGFAGASGVELNARGDLVVHTTAGDLVQHAPVLYQDVGGARRPVDGRFVIRNPPATPCNPTMVSFSVGHYDRSRPLVIDPVLGFSTYLGGAGDDNGRDVAADAAGYVYVSGYTSSADFPTAGAFQSGYAGGLADGFVAKLSPNGSGLVYASYFGGSGDDYGGRLALDAAGDVLLSGSTSSADFPTVNPLQPNLAGGDDAFVAKLAADGSSLVYSTYLGGSADDEGRGVAVDAAGNAYVTGRTHSADFPTEKPLQPTLAGGDDGFVAELTPDGAALVYSTYLGGSGGQENGYGIVADAAGDAFVTGRTNSPDFPTVHALQPAPGGGVDAFVAKLAPGGAALAYSTYLGGAADDHGRRIAVDKAGNAYVAGITFSANFPTHDSLQPFAGGPDDAFVAELRPDGTAFVYSTYLGGHGDDQGIGIAVNASGRALVTGSTASADFPTKDALQATLAGAADAFVAELKAGGTGLVYSTYLGGSASDGGIGIGTDSAGDAYVTGTTSSGDFPTAHAFQPANHGGSDAFVVKILPLSSKPLDATPV
jgi:hypothetical protein